MGFNTQPPEGGWPDTPALISKPACFNTQPPEGGWQRHREKPDGTFCFNTQPPEGGWVRACRAGVGRSVSTHSRPKAAGCNAASYAYMIGAVSTHSRPKAAGRRKSSPNGCTKFQHTAARRRLGMEEAAMRVDGVFQHTAARRRLVFRCLAIGYCLPVSTHSRPKAAGLIPFDWDSYRACFNTQPPEGGWPCQQSM